MDRFLKKKKNKTLAFTAVFNNFTSAKSRVSVRNLHSSPPLSSQIRMLTFLAASTERPP